MKIERMDDFFTARAGDYDEHMISNVEGCKEAYQKLVEIVPASCRDLLDKTTPRLIQFHILKNAVNPPFLGGFLIFGTVAA